MCKFQKHNVCIECGLEEPPINRDCYCHRGFDHLRTDVYIEEKVVTTKDSKIKSVTESIFNIIIGFTVACISNYIILPMFGYDVTYLDSLLIAIVFTIISLIRTYIIRRLFVNGIYEILFNNK